MIQTKIQKSLLGFIHMINPTGILLPPSLPGFLYHSLIDPFSQDETACVLLQSSLFVHLYPMNFTQYIIIINIIIAVLNGYLCRD